MLKGRDLYELLLSIIYDRKRKFENIHKKRRSTEVMFQSIVIAIKTRFYFVSFVNANSVNRKFSENWNKPTKITVLAISLYNTFVANLSLLLFFNLNEFQLSKKNKIKH